MNLFELAYACHLYGPLAGFDQSLRVFRQETLPRLDPLRDEHRAALFRWLNSWGCRQFAKAHHAGRASESLVRWADQWLGRLPDDETQLTEVPLAALGVAAEAYEVLQAPAASVRTGRAGNASTVTFGPTGAAKTLFAFRPNVFPPWDAPIRIRLGYPGSSTSFRAYLLDCSDILRKVSHEAGVPVASLPSLVGRPNSSPPKLIDEYNWVVVTRGFPTPSPDELEMWSAWSKRAHSEDS